MNPCKKVFGTFDKNIFDEISGMEFLLEFEWNF
jgi:hypothetical protein